MRQIYSWFNTWGSRRHVIGAGGPPPAPVNTDIVDDIPWVVFVNGAWEESPPAALSAEAQNTGIADGATMTTITDWSGNARHTGMDGTKPFSWVADGGRGYPALRAPTATGGTGCPLPAPVSLNATGVITMVLAVQDNEPTSATGTAMSLYRGSFYASCPVNHTALDQWAMRDDSGSGTGSVPDRWFIGTSERRTRLHVYEVDRTADPIVVRRWDNGVPQPDATFTRGTGTVTLTNLFASAAFGGSSGLNKADVLFAGVVNGALTSTQRDTIAAYFAETTGEPAWYTGWSYTQVEPWLKTLVNARWEADPTLAPASWQARAQNTGVTDSSTVNGVTDWGAGNHLVSPLSPQRFVYLSAGLNGEPTFSLDGVDDEVESGTNIELSLDTAFVVVGAPDAAVRVIAEHGPNATSGANGQVMLAIPSGAEFAGQVRRAGAYYRHRGPYADGLPHVIAWEANPNSAGVYLRVDEVSATSSTSNSGTPTGTYTDKLHVGARAGGSFAMGGEISFVAVIDGNKAAARVVEHQAALDYGI